MKEKAHRFQRLELFPLLRVFKKQETVLKRFEHLEIEGHKIKIKITEDVKKYTLCPRCLKTIPKDSLYCIYCEYVFSEKAVEDEEVKLEAWQINCPGCGRINNRNQKYCLYCGWRICNFEKDEIGIGENFDTLRQKDDLLSQGEVIILTIDGKTYQSTDKIIPLDVKDLMLKIKKDGYSKEMVEEWVKKKNVERQEKQKERYQNLQQRIGESRYNIFWRAGLLIGLIILMFSLRSCLAIF